MRGLQTCLWVDSPKFRTHIYPLSAIYLTMFQYGPHSTQQYVGIRNGTSHCLSRHGHPSLPGAFLAAVSHAAGCILAPEGGLEGTSVRVLPSSYRAPLSSPSSTTFPGPATPQFRGLPAAAVQALRGGPGTISCHGGVLHDELGLLEVLAQDPQAPSQGPCLGRVVTRDLFPPCDVCPFCLS